MVDKTGEVIVIGGGISGLTVAWHLKRAGVNVVLIEAQDQVGGCTQTERRDGFLLEKGPFNVIVRASDFEDLLAAVSDRVSVVTASSAARARYIYLGGRLLSVPTNPVSLLATPLLSLGGRLRLIRGLLWSRRAGAKEETMEEVATRRFGRQVSDHMVSAVIAGIFAGDIRNLSLAACFPTVGRVDRAARSLIGYGLTAPFRSKKEKKPGRKRRWRGLVSIDGGLGALMDALAAPLGAGLLSRCKVQAVRRDDSEYAVDYLGRDGRRATACARHVVIASPVQETARLIAPLVPEAANALESIESASLVVLNLGFRTADVGHPMRGYGFLVPHTETAFPLLGVLWADSIFPHHAPEGHRLMRVFIGGARRPELVERSDDELLALSLKSLRGVLQLTGEPMLVDVCRYESAIPQYQRGHLEKVERIRAAVAARPGLFLAGNYLGGVSLNDCVRVATGVAQAVISSAASVPGVEAPALAGAGAAGP